MNNPYDDHISSLTEMREFAANNLVDLCDELRSWQDTGILVDGKLRELAELCTFDTHNPLSHAERTIEHLAIRRIIQLKHFLNDPSVV